MELKLHTYWNQSIIRDERELVKRDYCYASELGMPIIDRVYKMNATPPTNPPNDRAMRKMYAGNLYEWVVEMILRQGGLVKDQQTPVKLTYDTPYGSMLVSGKVDFIAGGKPDFEKAINEIESMRLPDFLKTLANKVYGGLNKDYFGQTFDDTILEIKSVSSFVFEKVLKSPYPLRGHGLQCYHYCRGLGLPGSVVYICRDDARISEISLQRDDIDKMYMDDINAISEAYYTNNYKKEPLMYWDDDLGKFSKNLGVEYSPYLTLIYGFAQPEDYRDAVDSTVQRWNRVLKRIKDGAKMTDKNKEVIDEIKSGGYNVDELVNKMSTEVEDE